MAKYKTAKRIEDLDFLTELNSYKSVGIASDKTSFYSVEEKYRDVDFYIIMLDNSEEKIINDFLSEFGISAWLEYEVENSPNKMVRLPYAKLEEEESTITLKYSFGPHPDIKGGIVVSFDNTGIDLKNKDHWNFVKIVVEVMATQMCAKANGVLIDNVVYKYKNDIKEK